jgi:pyrroloquinoline quinone biosynthesis protein B
MPDAGIGTKTGQRMGHIAMTGNDGSMAAWAQASIGRRIYVHINNTNPVLDPASDQRKTAEAAGWEIGRDGQEIEL